MAKSKKQEQQEYNDILLFTKSLFKDIGKASDELAKSSDKRNKKLQAEARELESISGSIKSSADAQEALNKLQIQATRISKTNYGVNEKNKASLLAQNIAAQNSITRNQKANQIMAAIGTQMEDIYETVGEKVDEISDRIAKIAIVGKGLATFFKPMFDNLKKGVLTAGQQFSTMFNLNFLASLKEGKTIAASFKDGFSAAMDSVKSGLNPQIMKFAKGALIAGVAIFALKKLFDLGFASFKRIEGAAKSFREQTGLLNSQTGGLKANLVAVESQMAFIGANAQLVAEAAGEFTREFDGLVQPSKEALSSMIALNKSLGVGFSEAAKVTKVFRNLGDLTEDQAMNMTLNVGEMAKLAGVAPQKVMADIADSSSEMYKFFGGSGDAMAATAVEAAKLGSSIKEITKLSSDLLDYDSSINKELEASAILGTNLNFSQARYLAATNDTLGAYKAVGAQLDQLGDLTKLNLYEQQSIEQATGQQFQDLVNQQKIRQKFTNLDAEQLKAAQQYLKTNGDLNGLTKERLNDQALAIARENEMNSRTEDLKNKFDSVKTNIQNAFLPLAETFFPIMEGIASVVAAIGDGFAYITNNATSAGIVLGGLVGILGAIAVAATISAVSMIWGFLVGTLGPIGMALAGVATAGLMVGIGMAVSKAKSAGDVMSPADGKTRISTKEGGLYELSPNDDVMAAPGLIDSMSGKEKRAFSRAEMNLAPLLQKMDSLIAATKGNHILVADGKQLATTVSYNDEISLRNNFGINQSKSSRR